MQLTRSSSRALTARAGLGRALERPGQVVEHLTPNWFASVMGTGIVANAAATLPYGADVLRPFAVAVWLLAAVLLVLLTIGFVLHWWRHRDRARGYAADPTMSQFYGAPPMAVLTVGTGALLLGPDLVGTIAAVWIDTVLFTLGTALGLATVTVLPYRMIAFRTHQRGTAVPAWFMPIVPPMVSASAGALLLPHAPAGQPRLALLIACYAMFGLSLALGMLTLNLVWSRLVHDGLPPVQAVPTVWIALGVLGQSVTAVNLLGADAPTVLGSDLATSDGVAAAGLQVFGIVYGMSVGGFAALVFGLATALTVHAARRRLSFSLTWWSFTFPVGTCVTGASALHEATDSTALAVLAVGLFATLAVAWVVVSWHTLRTAGTGEAFLPPA